jgi:hypothetical protein
MVFSLSKNSDRGSTIIEMVTLVTGMLTFKRRVMFIIFFENSSSAVYEHNGSN